MLLHPTVPKAFVYLPISFSLLVCVPNHLPFVPSFSYLIIWSEKGWRIQSGIKPCRDVTIFSDFFLVINHFISSPFSFEKLISTTPSFTFLLWAIPGLFIVISLLNKNISILCRYEGQVVSVLTFHSDDPSSNPAEVYTLFCKSYLKRAKNITILSTIHVNYINPSIPTNNLTIVSLLL